MEGRNGGCSPRVTRSMISVWEVVCTEVWGQLGQVRTRAQGGLVSAATERRMVVGAPLQKEGQG